MKFESAMNLIEQATEEMFGWVNGPYGIGKKPATVGFGISASKSGSEDHKLAIRVQNAEDLSLPPVQSIRDLCKDETNIVITGMIQAPGRNGPRASDKSQYTKKVRPLRAGHSVGHYEITAGTLGCFVTTKAGLMMLSNNHVLANSNEAQIGDAILQPGKHDGGANSDNFVGSLNAFKVIEKKGNIMDAAVGSIQTRFQPNDLSIPEVGLPTKKVIAPKDILGKLVQKTGRTTGHMVGKVTAINIRNLAINYGPGKVYSFDQMIEVVSDDGYFSQGGDSGSFVLDMDCNAVGLLFAGGGNQTYICEIAPILKEFGAKIAR